MNAKCGNDQMCSQGRDKPEIPAFNLIEFFRAMAEFKRDLKEERKKELSK